MSTLELGDGLTTSEWEGHSETVTGPVPALVITNQLHGVLAAKYKNSILKVTYHPAELGLSAYSDMSMEGNKPGC